MTLNSKPHIINTQLSVIKSSDVKQNGNFQIFVKCLLIVKCCWLLLCGQFKEARCANNDPRTQDLAKVDTLFVPGGEEAVKLPPGKSRLSTVVCGKCPCVGYPGTNKSGMFY